MIRLETLDVSEEGLKASLEEPIHFGCRMMINVVLGEYDVADLVVQPVWGDALNNVFGFHIERATENWRRFVGELA